jgi:hypothetical protein
VPRQRQRPSGADLKTKAAREGYRAHVHCSLEGWAKPDHQLFSAKKIRKHLSILQQLKSPGKTQGNCSGGAPQIAKTTEL